MALVGEMSVLPGTNHGATVEATEHGTLRLAADGHALLDSDPAITKLVAVGQIELRCGVDDPVELAQRVVEIRDEKDAHVARCRGVEPPSRGTATVTHRF